jgi:hypothetical protein
MAVLSVVCHSIWPAMAMLDMGIQRTERPSSSASSVALVSQQCSGGLAALPWIGGS